MFAPPSFGLTFGIRWSDGWISARDLEILSLNLAKFEIVFQSWRLTQGEDFFCLLGISVLNFPHAIEEAGQKSCRKSPSGL
jgi:hypothetical protein